MPILVGLPVLTLGVAACAPVHTSEPRATSPPAAPVALPASSPDAGVIVSVRPMTVAASSTILIALNQDALARGARPAAAVEFIVRQDGGRTLSVVQADGGFRPGDRVRLIGGARTRVERSAG